MRIDKRMTMPINEFLRTAPELIQTIQKIIDLI